MHMTFSKNNMLHKVFTMTIILFLIFSTLGIQPAKASTPVKLSPVEQLNVQKTNDGSFIPRGNIDRYDVSARNIYPITKDYAGMIFNGIDTMKSITAATLNLYIVNGNENSNLVVNLGSNSIELTPGFPAILAGAPSKGIIVSKHDSSPGLYQIDVKALLEHLPVQERGTSKFIVTSDSTNLTIVKNGNSVNSQYNPYLEITYGAALNSAPTNISLSSSSVAENKPANTTVGTLSATDPDAGDAFTYSLVPGSGDNASFKITGNQLQTIASFNYETKKSYSVRIKVTDSANNPYEKSFTINVTDVNEAPTNMALSSTSVEENKPANTVVGTLGAIDPDVGDVLTYSLVPGSGDNASFKITGKQLQIIAPFDYETKSSYSVRIKVTDSANNSYEKNFAINVTNVNEVPTDITLSSTSVAENKPANTVVGTLGATDPDAGDIFTYSLVLGSGDNASFKITGNQLQTIAPFDYETKSSYSVRIKVTDSGGLSFEKPFTITVTDVNEGPIPTLVSLTPTDDSTNVSVNTNLKMVFSKNVTAVAEKTIRIYKSAGDSLIETIAANSPKVTVNGATVTINPDITLANGTAYYVRVDAGAFEDPARQGTQGISSDTAWNFTTIARSTNANLSNLVLSDGTWNPSFSAGETNYTVSVGNSVLILVVTPTTADNKATIKVKGNTVTSEQASSSITLNVGSNTIPIVVTAEDGTTTKTYTITVIREAPVATPLAKVTGVSLNSSGVASWTDIANETSYVVQLYKDGSPLGSAVSKTANATSHDFLGAMRAAGTGVYTVVVTAKGNGTTYLNGPVSDMSSPQTIIKLEKVTSGLTWAGHVAKWTSVANAVSYDVQLYQNARAIGTATNVLAGDASSGVDFSAVTMTNGAYTYTYRVIAKGNATLIVDGEESGFSNANIVTTAPRVLTNGITSLTSTSAMAEGRVTDHGNLAITERGFVYATTANPTTPDSKEMVAGDIGLYTATLSGLTPGTTYHYRAYAINSVGTSYGDNKMFTTTAPVAVPLTKVTGVSLDSLGVASWTDVANETSYNVQLYQNGSPLGSAVNKLADIATHDFLGAMRTAGAGVYTVTVTAKGNGTAYLDGPASDMSSSQTIIKLATVTAGLSWVGHVAKWTNVVNALSYDVQLYKNGTAVGTATNVLAVNAANGVDFSSDIQTNGAGTYAYTVTAKGNTTLIVDGAESAFSNANTVIAVVAPTVTTDGITSLTSISVVAGGNVTADGGTTITERGIVYATTANPTTSDSKEVVVGTTGAYTANLNGLTPGTTYHYRAYATNSAGTSYGTDSTFTTPAPLTYTVTYDDNDSTRGTVPIDSTNYLEHASVTVLSNTGNLEKTGYTFGGWSTKVSGGTLYQPTSSFPMEVGGVTLYAHWVSTIVPPQPPTDAEIVANAKAALAIGYSVGDSETHVTKNLFLTTIGADGTAISWASSHATFVANDGTVVRPIHTVGDQTVTLTATISKGLITETKIFTVIVKASTQTDTEAVANAKAALAIGYSVGDSATHVTKNLFLATTGADGAGISWVSSNPAVVTVNGSVLRPVVGDSTVVLTATIVKGNVSDTKTFTIIVKGQDISYPPVTSVPDEPPTSDSSSTPTSTVENINVDVAAGNGQIISQAFIRRTTNSDGTVRDVVTFTLQSATEAIAKLREQGTNIVRLILPDQRDRVNEILFSVPSDVVTILKNGGVNLEIVTNNVQILIPASSLETFTGDLYFRLVPIKAQAEKLAIEERAKKEATVQNMVNGTVINVLGHPMKIETNMQNRAVEITLPLPTDVTQEQLNHLAIFIEHSDGTKEIVRGQVVTLADGKLGIQFTVQKFSTFAVLYLPKEEVVEEVVEEAPVEEVPTPQVSTQTSYIQGYADGTFRPNAQITRAQMAAMLARNLSDNDVPVSSNVSYSDTTASWAKEEIEYVRAQGIMNGRADDMFYPNGAITRAQMAAIAIRWIDKQCAEDGTATYCTADTKKITFNDVNNQHWAASYIGEISSLGIMTGVNASTFNPNGYLTRAQAVKVLNRLFERDIKMESFEESFSDVTSDHWAFFEIQAAVTE